MKICSICKLEKPLDEFGGNKNGKGGKGSYCKPCASEKYKKWRTSKPPRVKTKEYLDKQRERRRIRAYGMDDKAYLEMLEKQDNGCAICGSQENNNKNQPLVVDHCHETNCIRGILCHSCNLMLGLIKEKIETLESAIKYLGG